MSGKNKLSLDEYVDGIRNNNRVILGKAISIIESTREEDRRIATELISSLTPFTGNSIRMGITGVPGVGKSTFIEFFGQHLLENNYKPAVLAIDPSSQTTGGSIMGDKTRMEKLASSDQVFIRPSPSGKTLGGIASRTRETMLLCEAAGYDFILIETVGVGQSETAVKKITDFLLLLLLPGGGDDIQGLKKGIIEMADALVVNKADGDNLQLAKRTKDYYSQALHLLRQEEYWTPPVLTCSALSGEGIPEIFNQITDYITTMKKLSLFENKRKEQAL
ncbi:MAG: methylmalonyl Co-A mutase-associated GTPase MeaB, partial [Cyclobacteriaceae bacterium]|nr:methylmalonyl Co-A mutase-associated GTPase MeaB [Cyclobacteriaceae bacterium]